MSEEELNEAMQYNLDYTEAMISDELFGGNEVAEIKLLASEKAIKDLQQKVEEKNKEIDRLNKEYERIYNENCKLRENHNINDITLLDENERLNRIIDNIFKFMQNKYDNSDLTGFTISFMELQDLKALKEE
jgi:hypothetical protein